MPKILGQKPLWKVEEDGKKKALEMLAKVAALIEAGHLRPWNGIEYVYGKRQARGHGGLFGRMEWDGTASVTFNLENLGEVEVVLTRDGWKVFDKALPMGPEALGFTELKQTRIAETTPGLSASDLVERFRNVVGGEADDLTYRIIKEINYELTGKKFLSVAASEKGHDGPFLEIRCGEGSVVTDIITIRPEYKAPASNGGKHGARMKVEHEKLHKRTTTLG